MFVRLGRHGDQVPLPLSAVAVHRLVRRHCQAAGVPERLAHPHALRAYWATHLLEAGVPVHEVSARLGHVDLRTTARYAAPRPERVDEVAEVLDRRHQAARRAGWGCRAGRGRCSHFVATVYAAGYRELADGPVIRLPCQLLSVGAGLVPLPAAMSRRGSGAVPGSGAIGRA